MENLYRFPISWVHLSHHAAVQILLHLTEGVGRCLSLAWDDDADVSDGQSSMWLDLRCPAVGDINALGGIATDISWTTRRCGLDELATVLESLLPFIQHTGRGGEIWELKKSLHYYQVERISTIRGHVLTGLIRRSSLFE